MERQKYWGRKYSSREISEARIREGIINAWQNGEKLTEVGDKSGIRISVQGWWKARKAYEEHGFGGLLDRRGLKGGRKPGISNEQLQELRNDVDENISIEEMQGIIERRFKKKISSRGVTRLIKRLGLFRGRGALKKAYIIDKKKGEPIDHAGVYFLKGAQADMDGVSTIIEEIKRGRVKDIKEQSEQAKRRMTRMQEETIEKRVETLLYLPMYDMQKPYHLLKYHKKGLGVITGSGKRYSYRTLDLFLCDVEKLMISKDLSGALAQCYVEALCVGVELEDGSYFYIDGHSKHVWSSKNIPKAYFTTLKRAERGLHQYFIHSSKGNPMILMTCPGDKRLTGVLFDLIDAFEDAVGKKIMKAVVFDREGLSLSIFEEFSRREGKRFITLLRDDMCKGDGSFKIINDYKPFKVEEKDGQKPKVLEWVAEGEYELKDKGTGRKMTVRTAMVKKRVNERMKMIPIITNIRQKEESKIEKIARRYFERWPNQENMFRDAREAIKVDTNHGYKKEEVPNRVVERKKEELETNLRGITIKLEAAKKQRRQVAGQLEKLEKVHQTRKKHLQKDRSELHAKIVLTQNASERKKQLKVLRRIESDISTLSEKYGRQISELKANLKNKERHEKSLKTQKENKEVELGKLDLGRVLYDIKTEKDHLMSNFKTLLINMSSYAQRQYFPKEYQSFNMETMKRTFYQQDGYVKIRKRRIDVTLHSYDEQGLQKAAEHACCKFNERDLKTSQGQRIWMGVEAL
jgi:hypothetical protein